MGNWRSHHVKKEGFSNQTIVHVYPPDEWYLHRLYDYKCQCLPGVQKETRTTYEVVVHNSFDGREYVEQEGAVNAQFDRLLERFVEEPGIYV